MASLSLIHGDSASTPSYPTSLNPVSLQFMNLVLGALAFLLIPIAIFLALKVARSKDQWGKAAQGEPKASRAEFRKSEDPDPIVQLANRIIEDAYLSGTSHIHIEPREKEIIVRNRIDGGCQEKLRLPCKVGPALVARLKFMSGLDLSEHRLPQDGRIVFKQYTTKNLDLELHVSTAPLVYGEGAVIQILNPMPPIGPASRRKLDSPT
jgi:type II secretory ATPase GspE/PulE/Tfp pilus assembly ATPase PilB-like protein